MAITWYHLLSDLGGSKQFTIDMDDEVIRATTVIHNGQVTWPPPKPETPAPNPQGSKLRPVARHEKPTKKKGLVNQIFWLSFIGALCVGIGLYAPESFISHFTVFVLATFLGWKVIWDVTPALHTPLMSVTNAISGIIIIGGMLQISNDALTRNDFGCDRPLSRHHQHCRWLHCHPAHAEYVPSVKDGEKVPGGLSRFMILTSHPTPVHPTPHTHPLFLLFPCPDCEN
jgi:hypothetical protein